MAKNHHYLYRKANEKEMKLLTWISFILGYWISSLLFSIWPDLLSILTFSPGVIYQAPGTFLPSGWDDSFISSLEPPPPLPFSLHSPPFAEFTPYGGVCFGVDEGSIFSVQGSLPQRKRVGQGLPVSPCPSWYNNSSCPSSPHASFFTKHHSPVEQVSAIID